ncbi:MAG: DNA polymerase IV [Pseudomonadota bacterium]
MQRSILHVDMDAFFASVEQRDAPQLRGKPVIVGGQGQRGVVAAASYESRQFGVRSAMPVREALQRCPNLICVKPRMDHYRDVSRQVFAIFRSITPEVEGLSLDEAFLDVTHSLDLFGDALGIARDIKARILDTTALHASVGVAQNKLVAKVASDLDKPDGLTVVRPGEEQARLAPLSVRVLPGIGPRAGESLAANAVYTVGDLQNASDAVLQRVFGRYAERVRQRALGIDHRPVVAARDDKSISAETTFEQDSADRQHLFGVLGQLADKTATRMRNKQLLASVVQIKIRRSDFKTFTRQTQLKPATNNTKVLFEESRGLLAEWLNDHPDQKIRLLGVGGSQLAADQQLDLFANDSVGDGKAMDQTVDAVRDRFSELGLSALQPASRLRNDDS